VILPLLLAATLTTGERAVYPVAVPANTAVSVKIEQRGIDVRALLRRVAATEPEDSANWDNSATGSEELLLPISETAAQWEVVIEPTLPHAAPGEYVITTASTADSPYERARRVARKVFR
jgi:hypothetical protein